MAAAVAAAPVAEGVVVTGVLVVPLVVAVTETEEEDMVAAE